MKISINGFIHAMPGYGEVQFSFFRHEKAENFVMICPHILEFELPENFNMGAHQTEMIEAKRATLNAALDREIKSLKAVGEFELAHP